MSEKHKLLGPLESINGVLMVGVSTAVLTSLIQETMKKAQNKIAFRLFEMSIWIIVGLTA